MKSSSLPFNEFIVSAEPPGGLAIPAEILKLCDDLSDAEQAAGRSAGTVFILGGALTDYLRGQKPNDVDIHISAPGMVAAVKKMQALDRSPGCESYREYQERQEDVQWMRDDIFRKHPLRVDFETMTFAQDRAGLGDTFQVRAGAMNTERLQFIDLVVTTNDQTPQEFFKSRFEAPITAVAYDATNKMFVYHRDYLDHVEKWRYEPNGNVKPERLAKARDKGMDIVI